MENQEKKELDYVKVLEAIRELPFFIGKNLLTEFLKGKETKLTNF